MKKLILIAAFVLILISGGLVFAGWQDSKIIKDQLAAEKIKFGTAEELKAGGRADLVKYANQTVDTGAEANAYASYIQGHLEKVAGGKTYSEVSAEFQKDKTNKTLEAQRQTLFMGEMLRGTLLNVWGWSMLGTVAIYSAVGLLVVALALLAVYVALGSNVKPVKVATKKPAKKAARKR